MQTNSEFKAMQRKLEATTRITWLVLKGVLVVTLSGAALMCGLTGQPVLSVGCMFIASMIAIS